MSEVTVKVATPKRRMDEIRPILDAALERELPESLIHRAWDGDVLTLSGAGASGSIVLDGGCLVGRARLRPPASLMRAVIEKKIHEVLHEAAGVEPAAAFVPAGA